MFFVPSITTSGRCATTSSLPGDSTAASAAPTTSSPSGAVEEALDCRQRRGRVVALVRAVQRQEHTVVRRVRSEEVEHPATERERVGLHTEVSAARDDSSRAALEEDRHELGILLAEHERRAGLHDAGLLLCDAETGGPEVLDVVELHVRHHRHLAVDDVGGVPGAAEPDLDHGDVHGHVGEPFEGDGVDDLEVAGPVGQQGLEVGDQGQDAVELVVGDGLAVPGDPLVEPLQIRAGVGPDREPRGHEQAGGDPGGRGLAVGAGDVDRRVLELGRPEQLDQCLHPREGLGRQAAARARRDTHLPLEVDVAVQPRTYLPSALVRFAHGPLGPRLAARRDTRLAVARLGGLHCGGATRPGRGRRA